MALTLPVAISGPKKAFSKVIKLSKKTGFSPVISFLSGFFNVSFGLPKHRAGKIVKL
jgi:hypothetical protein